MSYEAQLHFKQKEISHNLKNFSGMIIPEIDEIHAAPKPYFYRNKMEYAFSDQRWLTSEEISNKSLPIEKKRIGFSQSRNVGQSSRYPTMSFTTRTGQRN